MNTRKNPGTGKSQELETDRVARDAQAALDTVKQDMAAVSEEAQAVARDVKREARKVAEQASHEAMSFIDEQKAALCGRIDRVANVARKVADDLETEDATTARAAKALANSIGDFGSTLRNKEVDELVSIASDFGRRQPAAYLAAAALAGFAASRFIKASASRDGHGDARHRSAAQPTGTGDGSATRRSTTTTADTMEGTI